MKQTRLIVFLVLIISVLTGNMSAYAKGDASVYADAPVNSVDNSVIVPISIDNNPGLMGFKFHFELSEGLEVNSVSKGSVSKNGMLTDNVGVNKASLDVLWNSSEETKENGTLFYIGLISDDFSKESISISYSPNDTFNEQFENVDIECREIKLKKKQTHSIIVPENEFLYNALVSDIAQNIAKNEGKISVAEEYSEEKMLEALSRDSLETVSALPDKLRDDVLEEVYRKSAENKEENTVDESGKDAIDKGSRHRNLTIITVACVSFTAALIIVLLIIMRKKK